MILINKVLPLFHWRGLLVSSFFLFFIYFTLPSLEIKRCLLLGRKTMTNLDSILKSRDIFVDKGPSSQSYGFSSSHVWM